MKKNILITGGAGFIGSHLVEQLIKENKHNVIVLSLSDTVNSRLDSFRDKIKIIYTDKVSLEKVFKTNKIDCIVHLATRYIKSHGSVAEVAEMVDSNIKFPSTLCELAKENNVKCFINTGTFFEYQLGKKRKIKEGDPENPYNFYSATKAAFSEILKYYSSNFGIKVIDFKLFAPFGEKDNEKLLTFLISSLMNGKEIDFSGGEQTWNFTYVRDIAKAYRLAINHIGKMSPGYLSINVGYDKAISIKQLAGKLEKISGKKFKINWGAKPYVENEIFYVNCDNSLLKKTMGWQPDYDIDSALSSTYEYYFEKEKNAQKH